MVSRPSWCRGLSFRGLLENGFTFPALHQRQLSVHGLWAYTAMSVGALRAVA